MRIAAFAICAGLAGCATGTNVAPDTLAGIQKGTTTKAEVLAKFGTPTFADLNADAEGRSVATYTYVKPAIRGRSFAPIVVENAGVDATWTSTTFFFGKDDRVEEIRRFERKYGTGTEVFSNFTM